MQLTDEDVREFAAQWQQEFGEDLSPEAAKYHASQLMEFYQLLARFPQDTVRDGLDGPARPAP